MTDDGEVLFRVRVRPVVAITTLAVGLFLLLIAVDGLFLNVVFADELHVAVKVLLWILLLVAAVVTIVGLKQAVKPALIFEVTDRGIIQRMRAGIAVEQGQLIPWDRIESMELDEHAGYHGRRSRIIVVVVKLRLDEEWPRERLYNFDEARGSVMLDAFSGKP
ncbi:MAG: hypothetical protein R3174_11975, partial [Gammaproteobacteria bacterium]|nr:hypothetical protein [Gammaproteobacteria bacterium]